MVSVHNPPTTEIAMSVTFNHKKWFWTVRLSNGEAIYRQSDHPEGPWFLVDETLKNPSIDLDFRHKLIAAEKKLFE
jgi:hypothetical protein